MSDKSIVLVSASAGAAILLLLWTLIYILTGRFYPFGVLISIGAALLVGMRLKERFSPRRED
jgi:hypothetical protein